MAPESERHAINVCPVHGRTGNEPCAICYKPPTLTCSEVVERLAPFSNHSGSLSPTDSASGTEGTRATKEIREWLEWKSEHAQKRISELDGLGRHHIPLDSQLNGYLQGERDCAIDALKQLDNQSKRQRINGEAHGE